MDGFVHFRVTRENEMEWNRYFFQAIAFLPTKPPNMGIDIEYPLKILFIPFPPVPQISRLVSHLLFPEPNI